MGKAITREQIVEVLANHKYLGREEQAEALGLSRVSLWQRLKDDPTIEEEVSRIVKEATANTVRNGFARMALIIANRKSRDSDAIKAQELLLKYRGELIDRSENKTQLDGEITFETSEAEAKRIAKALLARGKEK